MTLIPEQYFPTYYMYNQHLHGTVTYRAGRCWCDLLIRTNYCTMTVTLCVWVWCCSHSLILLNVMT